MQFLESIQTCVVKKYCDFNGRASRSEFWWYTLGYVIFSYAWAFVIGLITGASVMVGADGSFQFSAVQLLSYIPSLLIDQNGLDTGRTEFDAQNAFSLFNQILRIHLFHLTTFYQGICPS